MMQRLDDKQQQRLAVAILAVAVAVVFSVTILPIYAANASRQDALDQAQARLVRYQHIAERDRELLPQYESLRSRQKAAGNHLRSDTVAVAGAELQRLVKQITGRHQAQIVSTQILPAAEEQGFVRVAIKVRVRGMLPALLQSLYDIENNDVHMFIDNLSLRNNAPAPRYREKQPVIRPMDADFDLIAYMPEDS